MMSIETQKSSELVDKAMSLIKQDIEINKETVGIDFSCFLGAVMNLISNQVFAVAIEVQNRYRGKQDAQFCITDNERMRNLFVAITFGVIEIAQSLEKELQGKIVYFMNTSKAITAIGLIRACDCETELEKIEQFVKELMSVRADEEINHRATISLLRSLK